MLYVRDLIYIYLVAWNLIELANAQPENVTKTKKPTTHFLYPKGTTRLYDPNYGFKQYWPGGDWVLLKNPPTKAQLTLPTMPGETTTSTTTTPVPPTVCGGEDCPHAYRHIKEVCVRLSTDWDWKLDQYKTFPTYCYYLKVADPQCIPRKYYGYVFVHVGKCENDYMLEGDSIPQRWRWHWGEYTPNNYLADVSPRYWWHMKKFLDQKEWTKFYPGSPYNVTLFRSKKEFKK